MVSTLGKAHPPSIDTAGGPVSLARVVLELYGTHAVILSTPG